MMYSPGVSGVFAPQEALTALLDGTSLAFHMTAPGSIAIEVRGVRESVEVHGSLPRIDSPKLTEPLRDIPQTITVIPRSVIEEQGATTLRDVLRNVAGITFQAGEGGVPAGDQLSIRGFSARTDMFVDGVRDFGGYSRDSFNMEQVEVAKGPTSALAGRGSTGGAINQVSKAPVAAPVLDVTLGAGNVGYQRSTIDINQPIEQSPVPGTAIRLNAMWNDSDVPNRDVVTSERWGIAPSLALGVGVADPRHRQLLQAEAGQHPGVRAAVGAGQHQSGAGGLLEFARRPSISRTSTGWSRVTMRRRTRTCSPPKSNTT